MDLSETEHKPEDAQVAEYKSVDDAETDENGTHQDSPVEEDFEVKEVSFPIVSLSQEFTQATEDPVEERTPEKPSLEERNGEIDFLPAQNVVSPAVIINSVSEGTESSASDEKKEVSALVIDSVSKGTEEQQDIPVSGGKWNPEGAVDLASNENAANISQSEDVRRGFDSDDYGGGDNKMFEFPESTGNQAFVAVPQRPLQRTSWWGCCGLFEFLRRSDQ